MTEYTHLDVLLYLLKELGGRVRGVKKLMKLLFLLDYEKRGETIRVYTYRGKPVTRTRFVIWDYGPFSRDVYDTLDEHEELFEIADPEPPVEIVLTREGWLRAREAGERLPEPVKRRVREVVERYGSLPGWRLARIVYEMLDLDDAVKEEYRGVSITRYLAERGLPRREVKL